MVNTRLSQITKFFSDFNVDYIECDEKVLESNCDYCYQLISRWDTSTIELQDALLGIYLKLITKEVIPKYGNKDFGNRDFKYLIGNVQLDLDFESRFMTIKLPIKFEEV
jgi:hypothetical protein